MAIFSMRSNRTVQVVLLGIVFLVPFYMALAHGELTTFN